jgi:hypothetical protein
MREKFLQKENYLKHYSREKNIGIQNKFVFGIFGELVLLQIIERLKEKKLTVPKRLIFKKCS